jgi:hypothetical protein
MFVAAYFGRGAKTLAPTKPMRRGPTAKRFRGVTHCRNARTGSVRAARHAGTKQAASAAIAITTKADPNASGSRGLTV